MAPGVVKPLEQKAAGGSAGPTAEELRVRMSEGSLNLLGVFHALDLLESDLDDREEQAALILRLCKRVVSGEAEAMSNAELFLNRTPTAGS